MNSWPPEHDAFLRSEWGRKTASTIATALGRTGQAVARRAQVLDLDHRKPVPTPRLCLCGCGTTFLSTEPKSVNRINPSHRDRLNGRVA